MIGAKLATHFPNLVFGAFWVMGNLKSVLSKASIICFLSAIGLSAALMVLVLSNALGFELNNHSVLLLAALVAGGTIGGVLRR